MKTQKEWPNCLCLRSVALMEVVKEPLLADFSFVPSNVDVVYTFINQLLH